MPEQLEFFPLQSPCRGICQLDKHGFCRGCYRSQDERLNWQKMTDGQKQAILRLCRLRLLRKLHRVTARSDQEPEQISLF